LIPLIQIGKRNPLKGDERKFQVSSYRVQVTGGMEHRAGSETGDGRPEIGKVAGLLEPKRRSVKNFGFVKHQKKILSDDR
jgi:hypothetical protein